VPMRSALPTSVLYELPSCVLIFDAAGHLRLATRRAEELLGLSSNEIAAGLSDSETSKPGAVIVSKIVSSELADPIRLELERPDESCAEIEARVTRVGGSTIVSLEDVSTRERRERAERDFVTNAAHELQTPLAAIASAVQVLQAGAKDSVDHRDRFLAHIEVACRRLERLARALLVLARAQTGVERPRQEIVAVAVLLSSVADGLAPGRTVDVDCEADVAVLANRPLLEQALANLGQNAAKHSQGPIVLAGKRSDQSVCIQVRDNGGGISEADRERIFERFYRGEAPTDGFVLGLSVAAEAVKAIDGELELETSSSGTNFSIRLPGARMLT
jgi:two-component system, OmpR family, sensor histidine kinase SenX3